MSILLPDAPLSLQVQRAKEESANQHRLDGEAHT
jgi:hypothetical protein